MSYKQLPNGKHHEQLILEFKQSDLKLNTSGFWSNLQTALGEWADTLDGINKIRPDLFKIHPGLQCVDIYEVEVTHLIDEEKISRIARLALALDDISWELHLFTIGRFGQKAEVNLHPHVMAQLTPNEFPS